MVQPPWLMVEDDVITVHVLPILNPHFVPPPKVIEKLVGGLPVYSPTASAFPTEKFSVNGPPPMGEPSRSACHPELLCLDVKAWLEPNDPETKLHRNVPLGVLRSTMKPESTPVPQSVPMPAVCLIWPTWKRALPATFSTRTVAITALVPGSVPFR